MIQHWHMSWWHLHYLIYYPALRLRYLGIVLCKSNLPLLHPVNKSFRDNSNIIMTRSQHLLLSNLLLHKTWRYCRILHWLQTSRSSWCHRGFYTCLQTSDPYTADVFINNWHACNNKCLTGKLCRLLSMTNCHVSISIFPNRKILHPHVFLW